MIRAALLVAALGGPASAEALRQCEGLVERLPMTAAATQVMAGICLYGDVRFEIGGTVWTADTLLLGGDVDALPDAPPTRLTGGMTGLARLREIADPPGLAWLRRGQAGPGMTISFDVTSADGVLRVNSFVLRRGEGDEIALTARLAGMPQVWPVGPAAMAAIRVQALDIEIALDGLFEALVLMPLGTAVLDLAEPAEQQVAALRKATRAFLAAFDGTAQAENAAQTQGFLDALPHPRGTLDVGIGGEGLSAVQLLRLFSGAPTPGLVRQLADAAALDIAWTPDAP